MKRACAIAVPELLLAGITVTVFPAARVQDQPRSPSAALVCRALEVKTAERVGLVLVTFHQAGKSDAPRLGELLRQNDGALVEFETSDGHAHRATLFRLGTCFGRGLLLLPVESAHLAAREQFWLRFPQASKSG